MKKYADLQDELLCERVFDVASSRARIPRQYEFQQADEIDQSGVCVVASALKTEQFGHV